MRRITLALLALSVTTCGSPSDGADAAPDNETSQNALPGDTDLDDAPNVADSEATSDPEPDTDHAPDAITPTACPPVGSELLADPPPETIPEGTCEPQPVSEAPALTAGTVSGTAYESEFLYAGPRADKRFLLYPGDSPRTHVCGAMRIRSVRLKQ